MTRRSIVGLALLIAAGCQDYKFNPVGRCIIQTGSAKIQVSSVSTADILFVVDDSGSMLSEQKRLADNFGSFINALAQTQSQRKALGLDPLEFHIAITTSSVFEAYQAAPPSGSPPYVCGAPTVNQCTISQPYYGWTNPYSYACSGSGTCTDLIDQYWTDAGPDAYGQGVKGAKYPAGNFMAAPSVVAPTNPRVLHFTKDLRWETWATDANGAPLPSVDPAIQTLVTQFQQNIKVGSRGSGMEQHLEGGRLAVQKAIKGEQPSVTSSEWPHPGAKMVVVWVGDEDDCSNPKDPNKSLQFLPIPPGSTAPDPNPPGADACMADEAKQKVPGAKSGVDYKMFAVSDYVDYFTGLGRPFSAAFIYSTPPSSCASDGNGNVICTPGTCACVCPPGCASCGPSASGACQIPTDCSGKSAGTRFHDLAAGFRSNGHQTLEGSVCDWNFGKTLADIAELVKPPAGLTLPTQPAASQVTLLQILGADGKSSRLCTGPGAGMDWQFVDCKSGAAVAAGQTSTCLTINHTTGHCEANPGETYIAQYIGLLPQPSSTDPLGGCSQPDPNPPNGSLECAELVEGKTGTAAQESAKNWTCLPTTGGRGACVCRTS